MKNTNIQIVCDSNPLDCQVFIVGYNAATEVLGKEISVECNF